MKTNCLNCYYSCEHRATNQCDDYCPIDALDNDDYIDEIIEQGRMEFRREWQEYISEYDN